VRFQTDLFGLKDALDSHSKSIDLNSAAGTHNREVVLGAIQDAKAHRDALIAQAGGVNASQAAIEAANKVYEDDIGKLKGMYVGAGGAARAFDDLAGTYNVNVVTHYTTVGSPDFHQHSIGEHASGGSLLAGMAGAANLFSVGEQGRELPTLPPMSAPAYVTPNSTINGAANGGGGADLGTITVVVKSDTGEELIRKIVTVARRTANIKSLLESR